MRKKNQGELTLIDGFIPKNKGKNEVLEAIDKVIQWKPIEKILEKNYPKGKSTTGRIPYAPLLLLKMTLIQTWFQLSDEQLERHLNDTLSFMKFCHIGLNDQVPDATVIVRFRQFLQEKNLLEKCLETINKQLEQHQLILKAGVIIDASITQAARKPQGKKVYEVTTKEGNPDTDQKEVTLTAKPSKKPGDTEASWAKKGNKFYVGYKRHCAVDVDTGLILSVLTSQASEHDSPYLPKLLKKLSLSSSTPIYTDKGYAGQPNESFLDQRSLKSRIQRKAHRNRPLSKWERVYNQLISSYRYRVEQVFGSIKGWFGGGISRYVGLKKMHAQHVLEAIAYNLYRIPGLIKGAIVA